MALSNHLVDDPMAEIVPAVAVMVAPSFAISKDPGACDVDRIARAPDTILTAGNTAVPSANPFLRLVP
jgi:hypothetical protein